MTIVNLAVQLLVCKLVSQRCNYANKRNKFFTRKSSVPMHISNQRFDNRTRLPATVKFFEKIQLSSVVGQEELI